MTPLRRLGTLAVLLMFACRTTEYAAVSTRLPEAASPPDACVASCQQPAVADDRAAWLVCMRGCPNVHVADDQACDDVAPIPGQHCTTAAVSHFSVGKTVGLSVGLAAALTVLFSAVAVGVVVATSGHGTGGAGGAGGGGIGGAGGGSGGGLSGGGGAAGH